MRGGLVIFSADNENLENPSYRRFLSTLKKDNLIVVSSVSPTGDKSSYSNYGTWVDIAAPGGDSNLQGVLSTFIDNRYGYDEGTSMACPQVAGIAALVVSHFQSDTLTPAEVKRRILTSVSPVDKYNEVK